MLTPLEGVYIPIVNNTEKYILEYLNSWCFFSVDTVDTAENNFSVELNTVGKTFKPRDCVRLAPKSALIQKRFEVGITPDKLIRLSKALFEGTMG